MKTSTKTIIGISIVLLVCCLTLLNSWFHIKRDMEYNSMLLRDTDRIQHLENIAASFLTKFESVKDKSAETATQTIEKVLAEEKLKDPRQGETINGTLCKYSYEFFEVRGKTNPGIKLFTCSETGNGKKIEKAVEPDK
ncbi:hypothetical protein HXK64_03025 [Candidatus Gracilibacteria bacterium]|nr:hypothetical protein [Candidatus Gracilibacteria bacterium]